MLGLNQRPLPCEGTPKERLPFTYLYKLLRIYGKSGRKGKGLLRSFPSFFACPLYKNYAAKRSLGIQTPPVCYIANRYARGGARSMIIKSSPYRNRNSVKRTKYNPNRPPPERPDCLCFGLKKICLRIPHAINFSHDDVLIPTGSGLMAGK